MTTDNSDLDFIMPFGVHEGKPLGEVPVSYIQWMMNDGIAKGQLLKILAKYEDEIFECFDMQDIHNEFGYNWYDNIPTTLFKEIV